MKHARRARLAILTTLLGLTAAAEPSLAPLGAPQSQRLLYNNPGLVVDLGVGLWAQPFPVDYDGDGDLDLLVATADVPSNGIYFFENPGGDPKFPLFKPGVRLDNGQHNTRVSYTPGGWLLTTPGRAYPDFPMSGFQRGVEIPYLPTFHTGRDNQWHLLDYDGDSVLDLVVGASDWRDYGWDNAFDAQGNWTRGPLHAHVYFMKNRGSNETPEYSEAVQLMAGAKPLDVYGAPSPCFHDWDGDGDLDLICGEFLDRLTYFENTGARTQPRYAEGRFLTHQGKIIRMDLEMLQGASIDWDHDGDGDLIVGQEDGRVALLENTGAIVDSMPQFLPPRFFQQEAVAVKIGALCTPTIVDWDNDGDEDIIAGDTAGYLNFAENLGGGANPRWAKPLYLKADGEVIRIQAGPNGSIQGPCEAKWGYTAPIAADWNHDGKPDLVVNSIWGKVVWYENTSETGAPRLAASKPIEVEWNGPPPKPAWNWWNPQGKELVTQWRATPFVHDLNGDGLNDLIMLDHEGYLAFFERRSKNGVLRLLPPQRIFKDHKGNLLRLNDGVAGKSGRRKFVMTDWDGDGRIDILINSRSINFLRNVAGRPGEFIFQNMGQTDTRTLAGHTTYPAIVDWNKDKIPDLLIGAEDGFLYYLPNPRAPATPDT